MPRRSHRGARIEVEGLVQLEQALQQAPRRYDNSLKTIYDKTGKPVAREARANVPEISGDLKGTIRIFAQKRGGFVAAGSASVPYAGPIHFGWKTRWPNYEPQPFLYEGAAAAEDEVVAIFETETNRILAMVWAETGTSNP